MKEYEKIVKAQNVMPHFQTTNAIPDYDHLVYQYRNFKSFWEILKSDSFWATNARFSNDEEEQKFGKKIITSIFNDKGIDNLDDIEFNENYIICFCAENDKLSQWRGYASEGGVSMGFDFGIPRAFLIPHSDIDKNYDSSNSTVQYVGLDSVCYVDPQQDNETDKEFSEKISKQINLVNSTNDKVVNKTYQNEIQKKVPFIKHSGFIEENEYRLVFNNSQGELNDCIRYKNTEDENLRYPYIIVKSELPKDVIKACVVRVCVSTDDEIVLVEKLENELIPKFSTHVKGCHLLENNKPDLGDPFCTGCVLRHWEDVNNYQSCRYQYKSSEIEYEYYLNEKTNCIVISQGENQKEIFEKVYECVKSYNIENKTDIKVWCEGHLPLRKITIGPCPNQSNMLEAIKHYCNHTYWLRDVEITVSKIPFRKSL